MKKTKREPWTWYPTKHLTEGTGIIGSARRRIEKWSPFETEGNPQSRKIRPLLRIRQSILGENKRDEYAVDTDVRIPFEHLPKSIKNYAEKEAQKTGKSIQEVLTSKLFRNYLLSRLK